MLMVLVAVSIVIFALVSELSRVSQEGMDDAITRDTGLRGSYTVAFDVGLQMTQRQQYTAIMQIAGAMHLSLWGYFEELPEVQSECPPFEQVGKQQLRVLWKAPGVPFGLPYGHISGIDTEWCINGQHIPASALFLADSDERSIYGDRLYISPYYRNLILLNTLGPANTVYTVVSGNDDDITEELRQAAIAVATPAAQAVGADAEAGTMVARKDRLGQNVKDAAAGAAITYGVIGWGVIILAALALLVMQTSYVRQRMWFYGLVQSLGASNSRIAALLLIDGAAIIAAGAAVAVGLLWLGEGTIRDFAKSAFGVDAHVLSGALIPRLAIGIVLILAIATTAPLAIALRRDPLAVLEAPRD